MCGIAAILSGSPRAGLWEALARMDARLTHRGPDGRGLLGWAGDGSVARLDPEAVTAAATAGPWTGGLAFRRLRIQDRSPDADAPLGSEDGRCFAVLNGEIYNFRELRSQLVAAGARFRTQTDTEVALASYQHWGAGCFERFNGIWALLILDLDQRVLLGSRDRLGVKPLFFALSAGSLLLASEPKAVAAGLEPGFQIEHWRLNRYLRGLPAGSPDAGFFRGVQRVPAASLFAVSLDDPARTPAFRRFWSLRVPAPGEERPASLEAAGEQVLSILDEAVRIQQSADVPVGCLLSGGLDSSLLARLLSRSARQSPLAFSLVYDDQEMDESRHIDAVLAQGGLRGVRHRFSPDEAWSMADAVIETQGEPPLGWDLLAQHRVFRLAREHGVVVVLDGQGADEILGGYPMYQGVVLRDALLRLRPGRALGELAGLAASYQLSTARILRRFVLGPMFRRVVPRRYPWLDSLPSAAGAVVEPAPVGFGALDRVLHEQTTSTNLASVLAHQDRNSMQHAVESRVPYLDHRLVELCFRLSPEHKVGEGDRKRALRSAARGLVPDQVAERRDKKAIVSTTRWIPMRQHAEELRAAVHSRALGELPGLRPGGAHRYLEDYLGQRHADHLGIWRLYAAARWLELFHPAV